MKRSILPILIAAFLFSTMEIMLKQISTEFNAVQLTFTRFLIGGLILLPFALASLKKRQLKITLKKLLPFALYGFIGITVSMTLYQLAISYTEASIVAVIFSSQPILVMALSYFILKEKIRLNSFISIIIVLIGILCIINPFQTKLSIAGTILSLLSAILFALYGVSGKKPSTKYGGVTTTCFSFLFGSAEMILLASISHIPVVSNALESVGLSKFASIPFFSGYSLHALPYLLYVSVCVTGIGFASYFTAIEKSSATTASFVFILKSFLAPVFALIILGEQIELSKFFGIILILSGSTINLISKHLWDKKTQQLNIKITA